MTDDGGLWALEYNDRSADDWLVLGSSRAACSIDLETFERTSGESVVQLAISAGQPVPVLVHLNESGFAGKLLVELSPKIWFSDDPAPSIQTQSYLQALRDQDNALFGGSERRATRWLQSQLRILHTETDLFDLAKAAVRGTPPLIQNQVLPNRQRYCWPSRQGAAVEPTIDTVQPTVSARRESQEAVFQAAIDAINGITSRGGTVLLFAAPEAGKQRAFHLEDYPDTVFANPLVAATSAPFVDAMADPMISAIAVPDGSHIDADDAPMFTKRLVERFQDLGALPRLQ